MKTKRGYEYAVDDHAVYNDFSGEKLRVTQGWRVTKQKIDGKDGRAYPRIVKAFFGDDAERKARELLSRI